MHARYLFAFPAIAILLLPFVPLAAFAGPAEEENHADIPPPTRFVTAHRGQFNGQRMQYTVTAGETYLNGDDGEPKASIFTFAYTKSDADNPEERPVTFVWNGGPGSASVWLHIGGYGPKRVVVPSDAGFPGPPPYEMVDAPETILDVTDLVFVDPVGTGFSRALGDHEGKAFWGLNADADSMAEFIRTWLTENGRWNSPRFLMGESFGTTRAALVAQKLEDDHMISLNGIIFVSQALDYAGSTPYVRDNIVSFITYVPTMAAVAAYHGKVSPPPEDLDAFLDEARQFAMDEYLPALFRGNTLADADRERLIERLAYFTGLTPAYIERVNLRIQGHRFAKELLRDEGLAVGRLDGRYKTDEIDDVAAGTTHDAASVAISPPYKAVLMNYMQNELGIDWDRPYLAPADPELSPNWNWRTAPEGVHWEPAYVNTAHALSDVLRRNPSLRVLVASGLYDLVTPFFDAEYTLNRHGIEADRIDYTYYPAGHMMYVNEPSRVQLLEDTRDFINALVP